MQRKALAQLLDWKKSPRRKPLILKGARQVGKTWLMKEFGRLNYEKTFYFSFEREEELFHIFEKMIFYYYHLNINKTILIRLNFNLFIK